MISKEQLEGERQRVKKLTLYRCPHCKKIVNRDSTKAWIPSYCDATGKDVRLTRQKSK